MKAAILSIMWVGLLAGISFWSHRRKERAAALAQAALLSARRDRYRPAPSPNDHPTFERDGFALEDLALAHSLHMHRYELPSALALSALRPESMVKLAFVAKDGSTERMWVKVESASGQQLIGSLANDPLEVEVNPSTPIHFHANHVLQIERPSG